MDDEDSPSPKSDGTPEDENGPTSITMLTTQATQPTYPHEKLLHTIPSAEDDAIGDGSRTEITGDDVTAKTTNNQLVRAESSSCIPGQVERRRRKLPEIPKTKRCKFIHSVTHSLRPNEMLIHIIHTASLLLTSGQTSLAEELSNTNQMSVSSSIISQRSLLARKCGYLLDEDSSPDSDRMQSLGDVDSGHSTAHSPTDYKSLSPQLAMSPTSQSPFPPPFGGVPYSQLEMLEATHRGLHKFIPRHHDEIDVEIGDPIYVQKEADDLWCEGVNLRTGRQGIFPSAYAVDLEYNDFDPTAQKVKKERYLLGYLGSVETTAHKGTGVVCQAVRKIVGERGESPATQLCILEISDQGLRMVERSSSVSRSVNVLL